MADFDDSSDPALGAACNRLAAWVEPLPEGRVIDPASGLTERDLALMLKHLRATRLHEWLSAAHDTSPPSAEPSAATIAPPPAVSAWTPPSS